MTYRMTDEQNMRSNINEVRVRVRVTHSTSVNAGSSRTVRVTAYADMLSIQSRKVGMSSKVAKDNAASAQGDLMLSTEPKTATMEAFPSLAADC